MPYLGRAPIGVAGSKIADDLKVTGTISGESINDKLALDATDGSASDLDDHYSIEDGGTDGSATNAGDNLLVEDQTNNFQLLSNINLGSDQQGDVAYYNGTQWSKLAAGTSGQFLKTQGTGANPAWVDAAGWTGPSTSVATTSGTSHDLITDIASGAKVIIINFENVSLTTGNNPFIRLGDSGGIETSGYVTCSFYQNGSTSVAPTGGGGTTWVMYAAGDAHAMNGQMIISFKEIDGSGNYIYVQQHQCSLSTTQWIGGAGSKSLSGELTQMLIATAAGAFDLGSVTVIYF